MFNLYFTQSRMEWKYCGKTECIISIHIIYSDAVNEFDSLFKFQQDVFHELNEIKSI